MYYTSIYRKSSSMGYRGKKSDAQADAKKYDMSIKPEDDGYFLRSEKIEVIIYEHDSKTKSIVRQCDPRPYLHLTARPDFKGRTDSRLATLVRLLNKGKVKFDAVIKAAEKAAAK